MKIQITGGGIYDGTGAEVPLGTEIDVDHEPAAWAGRYTVLSGDAADTLEAKAKGDKWFIVNGKGKHVGKELSEADAKGFNDLSDEDKAAFTAEHAKA